MPDNYPQFWKYPVHGRLAALLGDGPLPAAATGDFHPGLLLERLLPIPFKNSSGRGERLPFNSEVKSPWLFDFVKQANRFYAGPTCRSLLQEWHARRTGLLQDAIRQSMRPAWRWVIGMGNATPLETGLTLHHTLGVPFVPGPALKGVARAWATLLRDESDEQRAAVIQKSIDAIFGPDEADQAPGEGEPAPEAPSRAAGAVVFYDALPHPGERLRLTVDVMTPHFPKYYAGERDYALEVEDPGPIPFLVISGGLYEVAVTRRTASCETKLLEQALEWCVEGLENLGAGGKTAKGYGYFEQHRGA